MARRSDQEGTADTALVDALCDVADTLRLVELFCCGCAYVAEREGIHDGTALHVMEGIVGDAARRLEECVCALEDADWAEPL